MNTPQGDDYDFQALNTAFQAGLKRDIARAKDFRKSFLSDPSIEAGLKMVGEVVRKHKEKKQRRAQKIGELTSSVSSFAMSAVLDDVKIDFVGYVNGDDELIPEEFLSAREILLRDCQRIDLDLIYPVGSLVDLERQDFLMKKYGNK